MPMTFDLSDFISGNLFGFMLLFARLGSALMFFPGIGESFVAVRSRLLLALAIAFLLLPVLGPKLPTLPSDLTVMSMHIIFEILVGVFLGLLVRVMVLTLEFAGQVVALQLGVGNAFAFNPSAATQSSLIGSVLGLVGIVLVFATNLHHFLLTGIVKSYALMPATATPAIQGMSQAMMQAVTTSFSAAVMMAAPFFILGTLLQVALGIMSRLQPTLQVFFIALPLQILLGFAIFSIMVGSMMAFWLDQVADIYSIIGLG